MKKVYKLVDKSLVLATEVESTENTTTIKTPYSVTQMLNPQTGQPELVILPMDLIFADAADGKDVVTLKKEHIMYELPMANFPAYEQNYVAQAMGIETVSKSGIIT